MNEKHRSGWVTFKCQKSVNFSLAIKESLKAENGTQYTKYQINNYTKNQISAKMSHDASL